tara:strand:+ start:2769 stop:3341 length:573 start_codon:yes stop_codon:yes gene_type:complete
MENFRGLNMKSGGDHVFRCDSHLPQATELEINVTATVLAFTEKAVRLAEMYVEHNKRKEITPGDIKLGMAAEFFNFLECPSLEDDVLQWKNIILNTCQCDTDSQEDVTLRCHEICPRCDKNITVDETDSESESELTYVSELGSATGSECDCEFCVNFRKGEQRLINYTPTEEIEIILKRQILLMPNSCLK